MWRLLYVLGIRKFLQGWDFFKVIQVGCFFVGFGFSKLRQQGYWLGSGLSFGFVRGLVFFFLFNGIGHYVFMRSLFGVASFANQVRKF